MTCLRAACWLFRGCGGVFHQGGSSGQYPAADLRAEVVKESFFLFLSRDEFQQREKCIEMLEQLMMPRAVLQDGVQRWYAEQSAESPASQDMKEPVCNRLSAW